MKTTWAKAPEELSAKLRAQGADIACCTEAS